MNRAERRRQQKLSNKKKARSARVDKPDETNSQNALQRGISFHQSGQLAEAINWYQETLKIQPENIAALGNIGYALIEQGKPGEAVTYLEKAISIKHDYPEAHYNLGNALKSQGKVSEAIICFQNATTLRPIFPEALSNYGNTLLKIGELDKAIEYLQKAISIKPDFVEALCSLGEALREQGELDKAIAILKKAISINPNFPETYYNLAKTFDSVGDVDKTIANYQNAIILKPDYQEAYYNLGTFLRHHGRVDEAIINLEKAISIKPLDANAHSNMGYALFAKGQIKEGLEKFEWRWKKDLIRQRSVSSFSKPLWDGLHDLKDKTLFLWGEQGMGDIIVWSFCLPVVSDRVGRCILECMPKLTPLLSRSFPNIEVRPENMESDADRDDFDFHLPMGSIFRHFLLDFNDISRVESYLVPDPDRVSFWEKRLRGMGLGPFVGISWKSPLITPTRALNYAELREFAPIFLKNKDAIFINLQCKDYDDDVAAIKQEFGVTIHDFEDMDQFNNLDDVAALSKALDVVISVNTGVTAISAGVGTPTWIINWRQSSWNNAIFSPRGTSVRLFDRNTWESWDEVFLSIAEQLSTADFNTDLHNKRVVK
ncbi:MAG: glycosyltransferase family protein [Magnetococcales bacterium]|nr:glycosyltransferase family protein [Magnetococcales bacterium]